MESLATVGSSEALTARLRELEQDKAALVARLAQDSGPVQMVPDVGKRLQQVVRNLEKLPQHPQRDDSVMDKARAALRNLLGDVTVVEEPGGVFAQVELGRCITLGAENRFPNYTPAESAFSDQTRWAGGLSLETARYPRPSPSVRQTSSAGAFALYR